MFDVLHELSVGELRDLAAICRQSRGETLPPVHVFQQLAGADLGGRLGRELLDLAAGGWAHQQLASVAEAVAGERLRADSTQRGYDLVLSGPEVPGIPTRDTAAVMHALLAEARNEVLLVGYAIHKAQELFKPLAERMASEPGLRVWFCLDISRRANDPPVASEIVGRFRQRFWSKHWPWEPRPDVYYDPRSLVVDGPRRSSLHAKCIVIDRETALVTSANFTEAAQHRNVECGVIAREPAFCNRIVDYFEGLRQMQILSRL